METVDEEKHCRVTKDKRTNSVCEEAPELPPSFDVDGEKGKRPSWPPFIWPCLVQLVPHLAHPSPLFMFPPVTPSDSVVRRSISQQKSGVSVTIDDPVRTTRQPSPPHGKVSNIIHVTNLVGLWLGALYVARR